jgi:hypothetical protein
MATDGSTLCSQKSVIWISWASWIPFLTTFRQLSSSIFLLCRWGNVRLRLQISKLVTAWLFLSCSNLLWSRYSFCCQFSPECAGFHCTSQDRRSFMIRTDFRPIVDRPPLWSSGQSSCLQIQRPGFDSPDFLERGPLSLVSTIEELLEIKSSGSGLENRDYSHRDSPSWQRGTLYPQHLTLTSSISGGRSVGIVRSRIRAMEFSLVQFYHRQIHWGSVISICDHLESDLFIAVIGTYLLFTQWIGAWEHLEIGRAFVITETIRGRCFLYAKWSL